MCFRRTFGSALALHTCDLMAAKSQKFKFVSSVPKNTPVFSCAMENLQYFSLLPREFSFPLLSSSLKTSQSLCLDPKAVLFLMLCCWHNPIHQKCKRIPALLLLLILLPSFPSYTFHFINTAGSRTPSVGSTATWSPMSTSS